VHDFLAQILPILCTATAARMLLLPSCTAPLRPLGVFSIYSPLLISTLWSGQWAQNPLPPRAPEAVGNTLLELLHYCLWSNKSSIKKNCNIHVDRRWHSCIHTIHRKGTDKVATALLAAANRWQGRNLALWALRILTNMSCSAASNHLLLTPETMHFLVAAVQPCTGASTELPLNFHSNVHCFVFGK